MQQRIKCHWCILHMVKHSQEHDKIKHTRLHLMFTLPTIFSYLKTVQTSNLCFYNTTTLSPPPTFPFLLICGGKKTVVLKMLPC